MSRSKELCPLPFAKPSRDKAPMSGALCKTSDFCKKRYNSKCLAFYKSIKKEGIHTCPYGYSCYAFRLKGELVCFSSIAIKSFHNAKKLKEGNRMPSDVFSKSFVDNCKALYLEQQKARDRVFKTMKENALFSSAIHEVRNFNSQLKAIGEIAQHKDEDQLRYSVNSSLAISQMVSSRLNYLSFNLNPKQSSVQNINLFKKIDKAVRLIRPIAWNEKKVKIVISGSSSSTVEGYDFLEQLPAILIHNAFKFALKNTEVEIEITEVKNEIFFTVKNVGTFIHEDEREKIYNSGYRGREAKKAQIEGTGLGLDFVKRIIKVHDASISLEVGESSGFGDDLIASIKFIVRLKRS